MLRIVRFFAHATLAASITALFYLGGPAGAAIIGTPERVTYEFVTHEAREVYLAVDIAELLESEDDTPPEPEASESAGEAGAAPRVDSTLTSRRVEKRSVATGSAGRQGAGAATRTRPAPKGGQKCEEPTPGIVQLDGGQWQVERALVESYTSSLARMNTLGAAYVHKDGNGERDGFLVRGVRCGNPLHQGGIRNGDVVHAVNGKKVQNLVQAVLVYNKVKNKDEVEVEITRKGRPVRLVYRIT